MQAPLIFKLRVISPQTKNAGSKNSAHLLYIGKRTGVELNEGMSHGAFGKVCSDTFGEIEDIKQVANYIASKTEQNTIMYRAVISFSEKDAFRLGYDQRSEWQNLIKQNIFEMADKLLIPASRLEYVCAVHMDKGHPHMHFMFWDKDQGVKKAFVPPSITNQIRIGLIKKVFQDELSTLNLIKAESSNIVVDGANNFFKDFCSDFKNISDEQYLNQIKKLKTNSNYSLGNMMNSRISPFVLESFGLKIFDIKKRLPKTGRLNYAFLPPDLKTDIENIIKELVDTNEDFSREFERYATTCQTIASYYTNNKNKLENIKTEAEKEIIKKLCNKLLQNIKKIDIKSYESKDKKNQKNFRKTETMKILKDLFSLISRLSESKQHQCEGKKSEISKQAKKELAIKLEHASSIDWER